MRSGRQVRRILGAVRTLVCQPRGALSIIRIYANPETLVKGEFEAWTLATGKQIVCVELLLHKLLERHHMGGSYDVGALYAFEYAEMCAVLRDRLGPSDRDRYLQLKQMPAASKRGQSWSRTKVAAHLSWRLVELAIYMVYKTVTTIVLFVVVAVILSVIGKRR